MDMVRFHHSLLVSLAALLSLAVVAPAFADPINSPHAWVGSELT